MPQFFQVLRCYKCLVFQHREYVSIPLETDKEALELRTCDEIKKHSFCAVEVHQAKKSPKFECKLCGEQQSIKRHYGTGTAKDCRMHVQRLNGIRGEIDELKDSKYTDTIDDEDENDIKVELKIENKQPKKSKWLEYVDKSEENTETSSKDPMYLNDTKVVLEVPKKRKKNCFKCPTLKTNVESPQSHDNHDIIQLVSNNIKKNPLYENEVASNAIKLEPLKSVTNLNNEPTFEVKQQDNSFSVNISKALPKKFIPPVVASNSKWAHFVEEDEETKDNDENDPLILNSRNCNDEELQNLFALCDDNDLDDVLNIENIF